MNVLILTVGVPRVKEVDLDALKNPHFNKNAEELDEFLVLVLLTAVIQLQLEDGRESPVGVRNKPCWDAGLQVVWQLASMVSFETL